MFTCKERSAGLHFLLAAALLLTADNASAQKRAGPEKVQELAEKARDNGILKEPVQNYRRIRGLFIKSGAEPADALIKRFRNRLEKAETIPERAVLHYLIAETYRHEAVQNIRSEHDPAAMESLHETALPHLVKAYGEIRDSSGKEMLKTDISRALNRLLAEGAGAKVSADMRKKLIETYIEASSSSISVLGMDTMAEIYRDLGIENRLLAEYAEDPGQIHSYKRLLKAMRRVRALKGEQAALPYAQTLWQDYRDHLMEKEEKKQDARRVMEVFTEVEPRTVLESFTDVTERYPRLYLQLYYAAGQTEQFNEEKKYWQKYLVPCLQQQEKMEHEGPLVDHHWLSRQLEENGDYEAALFVIRRALKTEGAEDSDKYGYLLLRKARCFEELGRTDKARSAYTKCRKADNTVEAYLRENAEKMLEALKSENQQ